MFQGKVGKYSGFTSTSGLLDKGFVGALEVFLKAPKGTSASCAMGASRYGTKEGEVLLNVGTKIQWYSV